MTRTTGRTRRASRSIAPALAAALVATACGSPARPETERPAREEVHVYLFREGASPYDRSSFVASPRAVGAGSAEERLRAALQELLKGTTSAEESEGMTSIFSSKTAGMLEAVTLEAGKATVDFGKLREVIPQAETTYGGAVLIQQLNHTVFGVVEVEEVEYRVQGSCDDFWEWLQSVCSVLTRDDWESGRNPLERT